MVLAGRSNVGKSSFINHFFQNKGLAKTSSKPGKTGLLNFFNVDERLFFVDIPGYGYAKRSKAIIETFREMIDLYFHSHLDRITFLHFIDGRHPPSESDWEFIHWMKDQGKNVLFIITKIDKVKPRDRTPVVEALLKDLEPYGDVVIYNIEDKAIRKEVKEKLAKILTEELVHGQS